MSDDPKSSNRKVRWDPASPEFQRFLAKPKITTGNSKGETASQAVSNVTDGASHAGAERASPDPESHAEAPTDRKARDVEGLEVAGWLNGVSKTQIQRTIDIISPPPRLSPSEWAEKYAYLPEEENAEPGKFHLSRRPHQAAMLNDPIDPKVREVWWMGASQAMGKTVCLIILLEYVIHQMRKSIQIVYPAIDKGIKWKRSKFLPTVRATPCMAGLLAEPRQKDSESTTLNQKYPGGSLSIIGANSPSGFRGSTCSVVVQDEIDAYEENPEGDPCDLGDRAAKSFSDKWLIKCSTTTFEGASRIYAGYLRGDQQKYFLPCPLCGGFQHLLTERMKFSFTPEEHSRFTGDNAVDAAMVNVKKWELGDFPMLDTPKTIYVCEHCQHGWTDVQRIEAYMSGHKDNPPVMVGGKELRAEWRATAVDDKGNPKPFNGVRSRHLNGMYWATGLEKEYENYLHQFAEQFLAAKHGGRAKMVTWTNTFKNEPFIEAGEKMEWQPLRDRAEDYGPDLEPGAIAILHAEDIQKDRVEILWAAFGVDEQAWLLEYEVFPGDFNMPAMRDELKAYIFGKRFNHPYLGELGQRAGAMDCGHQTKVKAVFKFCKECRSGRILAIRGAAHDMAGVWERRKSKEGVAFYFLNGDELTSRISDRISLTEAGPNFIHIPKEVVTYIDKDGVSKTFRTRFNDNFYKGLCAEKRMLKRKPDGTLTHRWEKDPPSARNEPIDMMKYIWGLYDIQKLGPWIGQQWQKVEQLMREKEALEPKEVKEIEITGGEREEPQPPKKEPLPASAMLGNIQRQGSQRPPNIGQRPNQQRRPMRRPQRGVRAGWSRGLFNPLGL